MLTDFIQPIREHSYPVNGKPIYFFTGDESELGNFKIAIFGILDSRGNLENNGCETGPNFIRKQLYQLHHFDKNLPIIDLGNIYPGEKFSDTIASVKEIVSALNKKQIISIVLGGDMSLTLAQYRGMKNEDTMLDIVVVDERLVIMEPEEQDDLHESNYIYNLFTDSPNKIRDFKLLGYQTYFNHGRDINILEQMNMESFRLGKIREDMMKAEPLIRDADMLSFNISALKACDAPGYAFASPNGFFSDEACQIMRFAGASDKLSSIGIYNFNPEMDVRNITAIGIAQMIWYFIEGIGIRKQDYPITDEKQFQKFIINIEDNEHEIVFLKSKKSDRWWFQIPIYHKKSKKSTFKLVPCSYKDYLTAVSNEIPERWLNAFSQNN